jgi:Ca2+-binding EF-hand superfamily protein
MLQGADKNNDGAVDRSELEAMQANAAGQGAFAGQNNNGAFNGRGGNEAMGMFLQYDRNHDGRLTTDEVPQQAVQSLRVADINRDGVIDAAEFQALSQRMGNQWKGQFGPGMNNKNGQIGVTDTLENNNRNRNKKN